MERTHRVVRRFLYVTIMIGLAGGGSASLAGAASAELADPHVEALSDVDAGRYIAVVGGCNDCHTAGYAESPKTVPESEWLAGSPVGWRGPWGTTYPANLRLMVHEMSEDAFVAVLRHGQARPPMPSANTNRLSDRDARALYRYIRSLGPRGERMPAAAAPGEEPKTPYISMEPLHLERIQARGGAAPAQ